MLDQPTFPAIYESASQGSTNSQRTYLGLIICEYAVLLVAAILSMDLSDTSPYYSIYAIVFMASMAIMLYRSISKPEQVWYQCRAVSESIKTLTWRYMMCSDPFLKECSTSNAQFRSTLKSVIDDSRHIGDRIGAEPSSGEQITQQMTLVRGLELPDRKEYYERNRIRDQRSWYAGKAGANKRAARRWMVAGIMTYLVATCLVILRIAFPAWKLWPIEPLIVFASSIVGWVQIKKYNELASAYTLTAHEIGLVQNRLSEIVDEATFSEFVNDAELAFSREHTQWVVRQLGR